MSRVRDIEPFTTPRSRDAERHSFHLRPAAFGLHAARRDPAPNPRLHAGMTSPVGGMYMALEGAMSRRNEAAVFMGKAQLRDVLRGLFANYYDKIKKENWSSTRTASGPPNFPRCRSCFRRPGSLLRSRRSLDHGFDRRAGRNAFELSGMFGFEPGKTVYMRINRLAAREGMVGYALVRSRRAFSASRRRA